MITIKTDNKYNNINNNNNNNNHYYNLLSIRKIRTIYYNIKYIFIIIKFNFIKNDKLR